MRSATPNAWKAYLIALSTGSITANRNEKPVKKILKILSIIFCNNNLSWSPSPGTLNYGWVCILWVRSTPFLPIKVLALAFSLYSTLTSWLTYHYSMYKPPMKPSVHITHTTVVAPGATPRKETDREKTEES